MWGHNSTSCRADVVAAFDNQGDADEALLRLRLAGFRDKQIGYTGRLHNGHTTDMLERSHTFAGAVLGSIIGAAIGVALTPLLNRVLSPLNGPHDLFGLGVTAGVCGAMLVGFFGGWIGMSMHRRGTEAPATDREDGPFVMAVSAGDARPRAWEILHQHGHDLHSAQIPAPGAT
ncbi:hypothetical protein R5W23_002172 [Gemmata sp. JC673]|uniref:DUF3341 domain-containing protein n=1 Tax=Gemmata algarum TaxID=2975278 RepID=A0ABU5F433_9BACT|nr:hypothetical protein [Gemmata algarum]MDY3560923.1 hypothetical protein [Gemmata algarum]